jgi:hypothetical protein
MNFTYVSCCAHVHIVVKIIFQFLIRYSFGKSSKAHVTSSCLYEFRSRAIGLPYFIIIGQPYCTGSKSMPKKGIPFNRSISSGRVNLNLTWVDLLHRITILFDSFEHIASQNPKKLQYLYSLWDQCDILCD